MYICIYVYREREREREMYNNNNHNSNNNDNNHNNHATNNIDNNNHNNTNNNTNNSGGPARPGPACRRSPARATANLPTNIMDFRGFGSSIILRSGGQSIRKTRNVELMPPHEPRT